jgi:hypothetical protein
MIVKTYFRIIAGVIPKSRMLNEKSSGLASQIFLDGV